MSDRYKAVVIGLGFLVIFFVGCSKNKVRDAFEGKLTSVEGNKAVTEYCRSCHVHKVFEPNDHVIDISRRYSKEEFRRAKECRQCHTLNVDFWGKEVQGTYYPADIE